MAVKKERRNLLDKLAAIKVVDSTISSIEASDADPV